MSQCAQHSSSYIGQIDNSNKTINATTSNVHLHKYVKALFREKGWKVIVLSKENFETIGSIGDKTKLQTEKKIFAKYRLVIEQRQIDLCFNFDPVMRYDLSIIENSTGQEVFLAEGQDCAKNIAEKLEIDLEKFW